MIINTTANQLQYSCSVAVLNQLCNPISFQTLCSILGSPLIMNGSIDKQKGFSVQALHKNMREETNKNDYVTSDFAYEKRIIKNWNSSLSPCISPLQTSFSCCSFVQAFRTQLMPCTTFNLSCSSASSHSSCTMKVSKVF